MHHLDHVNPTNTSITIYQKQDLVSRILFVITANKILGHVVKRPLRGMATEVSQACR